ncbi:MAG: hypothetical protein GC179_25045 [Anaerolineaceae bacterium]|nr:hypothetical protein [Anaerolineaceae bacterium]
MTSFQLPSTIFPENAIKRAELIYQRRAEKRPRAWRRWLNVLVKWVTITIVIIFVATLLLASITQRDPTPIFSLLGPLPALLILFTVFYDIALMFRTIASGANSISREREGQTWEMLVLTGVNARQIVRGKWWATVQKQFPRYLMLSFIRAGATTASAVSLITNYYYLSNYYNTRMQLPHPLMIVISILLGVVLTVANLGFSAACGLLGSAVSKRSSMAVARGVANQIVLSLGPALAVLFIISRIYFVTTRYDATWQSIYSFFALGTASLIDNGFNLLASPLYVRYAYYNGESYSPILPIEWDWIVAALLTLAWYIVLTRFALWRAEKRAVSALATPVS